MTIQINVDQLVNGILILLGVAIGVVLLLTILKLLRVLGRVDAILSSNQGSIDTTLKGLPAIVGNAEHITSDVHELTGRLKVSIADIASDAQGVTHIVHDGVASLKDAVEHIGSSTAAAAHRAKRQTVNTAAWLKLILKLIQIAFR